MAPSTYYAAKTREPSAREVRDALLRPVLRQLWEDNYRVYGARKLWKTARRAGWDVGRDQVARLMRAEGIEGARRAKRVRTTKADPAAARHPDLVKRDFTATTPNQLCVTDLTYVPTWTGVAYVCLITDVSSRMIVGWRVAPHMRTEIGTGRCAGHSVSAGLSSERGAAARAAQDFQKPPIVCEAVLRLRGSDRTASGTYKRRLGAACAQPRRTAPRH